MERLGHILVATALAMILAAGGAARAQGIMGMGTMAPGSLSYATGSALAEMMVQELGIETRVQPNSGESTLLALLDTGELDFAVANALEAAEAFAGEGAFAERPLEGIRVVAALYPLRVGLFVRADSDIRTMQDLRGKRVTAGFSASAAIATLLEAALAGGGLTLADIVAVPVPNVVAGADQFVDGRVDAFFFAIGAAKVSEVDASVPVRLLPLDDDEGARQRVATVFTEAYIDDLPPAPGLAGVDGPAPVLAFDNLLLTRAAVPDAVVTSVVAGIAEHHVSLAAAFPPFRGLDPAALHKDGLTAPYHPAVLAWADR
jgi:TRAP transporter TAXI family solute receptor